MTKMRWDPATGEPQIFADDDTVPAGWLDYHPNDPDKATVVESDPAPAASKSDNPDKPMTKLEVVAALTAGGVEFDQNAKVGDLTEVLVAALKEALTENKVEFDQNASPRQLLKLVQG